jgi:hypothetical protein
MDLRLAPLALVLVAGCASTLDWTRPGATQASLDADLKACRLGAESYPGLPRLRTAPPSATGSTATGTDIDADVQLERAQRVDACMRGRGYELVRK